MTAPRTSLTMDVLVVDDAPATLDILSSWLKQAGYSVRAAISGELALRSAFECPPALVILDVRMPGIDGFEVCRRLRLHPGTSEVAVIFVSGLTDVTDRLHGFEVGGVDFITKPLRREEVLARVNAQMRLCAAMDALNSTNRDLESIVKQRTADLLRERNTAQNYLDIASVAVFAMRCNGNVFMINKAGEAVFGLTESAMVGSNLFDTFVCKSDRNAMRRRHSELIAAEGATTQHSLVNILNARGQKRTISCNTKLLRDESGQITGTLTSAEDVTEVLLVQENLRKSEERYRGYVENAPDAIFITDYSGLCIDANPAACDLVRVCSPDISGKSFIQFMHGEDADTALQLLADATRGQKPNAEVTFQPRSGSSVTASVKALGLDENRILWFCTDITNLRHAEFEALARAQELDEALTQLHRLTAHMHDSIERERLAIATDIHDQVGALLTGAKLLLD